MVQRGVDGGLVVVDAIKQGLRIGRMTIRRRLLVNAGEGAGQHLQLMGATATCWPLGDSRRGKKENKCCAQEDHLTPKGLRDWERGGLLEAIAYYRSKLEAVVFMWVPAHVGIACNAYADAVATAYLGNNDAEDASKVVRDAVRTRPCMYTVRKEMAEDPEKREISDRRTYGHMRQSAHEWVCEQLRKTGWRDGCGAKWL
ncbi:hypothetical protein EMIHUDRAFT_260083 [Emiliania huxleyi CCMP1516]|uniref:RNase H type-1 domain-containing protein n=2 Tax=Emiliania huxleyi TaxID=2903 RepID=A0A0D3KXX2_EMIH1|nr:hypothetical protein EMIHUDRAFT_260083 [Emiliania huxleyi CCMP1516]EOD40607.1 hypothetical protein EMIHUDRAFT_260083 [Emiliania huxleyi CCMP1516]|eukprot:XP_005793036.1 hypothetical protein EMIHUDRAFT_260083 [Emiliania huxleyi CCMP1516]